MADRHVAKWQQEFEAATAESRRLAADVQRWEELPVDTANSRAERSRSAASLRGRASTLKVTLDALSSRLHNSLTNAAKDNERLAKQVEQFKQDLLKATTEADSLLRRAKAAPGGGGHSVSSTAAASGPGAASAGGQLPASSTPFARLPDGPPSAGAELQPVSQRAMLQQQQDLIRSFDEPLNVLESSVGNLRQVGTVIRGEIGLQNRMLDDVNEATDRAGQRLQRENRRLNRFAQVDRNRWLTCMVVLLLIVLIVIFFWMVLP
mmetsp:Transcript_59910/g.131360  ORF Transcript_59910/g.131360 Transcript_59910/m.131360 type:complete len:264 (+) Transcript_59910:73-864(+)|eukprot:CAMPEP_0206575930 /NCGR_PEP_ID=MMETSP0325_2-20121206/30413_1 /ASSEMBLY_ACC=CAM_ASM_000347 /TAXON_ID=2866 /ORGANISM="Crypthecodinium cohnii, Strain Seligo" /LENGTH=263 /DNA_ID=CAMNT_0054080977 /DNA_START=10 /DNA_END=801 /DNA_ORIENTATION=+